MAYEGWFHFNDVEIANAGRTVELARVLGIDSVRQRRSSVQWIEASFDEAGFGDGEFGIGPFGIGDGDLINYRDITEAPWYNERDPASAQFAGFFPLSVRGLEDSTASSSPTEHTTDGGSGGRTRNGTLPLVFDGVLVASTERGAEFGRRWLTRTLRSRPIGAFCAGSDLTYFRVGDLSTDKVHRRDVALTRGISVTRKRTRSCSTLWRVTFTLTANDPYEYGEPVLAVAGLGGITPEFGLAGSSHGVVESMTEVICPSFDYSPVYDPLYSALVSSPTAPNFLPDGWNIEAGMPFTRYWARVPSPPEALDLVPLITLSTNTTARRVRVSLWSGDFFPTDQCDPLYSVVVNYVPPANPFYVDGEQQAAYMWDGASPFVRRGDSLVFSPTAGPVQWASVSDPEEFLVTLDLFNTDGPSIEGDGTLRAEVSLIPKTD